MPSSIRRSMGGAAAIVAIALGGAFAAGCGEGDADKALDEAQQTVEDAAQDADDATQGAQDDVGNAVDDVDEATQGAQNDAGDALNDEDDKGNGN